MISTRAFLVVATCIYLRRIATQGKKANITSPHAVLEVEEDIDSGYTGESATLMEWVDLRDTDETTSKSPCGEAPRTALAAVFPFPEDAILLRNAVVCSIVPSDELHVDEKVPTYADMAKSIMDTFWYPAELDDGEDANSDMGVDEDGGLGGEDWDAWTGVMRLRTPAPTPTSIIMTLPALVTPSLSASSEPRYAAASVFRSATSTLGSILNWTCGVVCDRGPGCDRKRAQPNGEYPMRTMKKKALSGPSYAKVEDDVEDGIPSVADTQLERPAIAINPPRRAGGWMRVDADDIV
ncbi:unnamed protein product [Peniophora sp. CBMAI 1063]|nr:unnamed protein product [Peniophora sp. CBMAI 1063]